MRVAVLDHPATLVGYRARLFAGDAGVEQTVVLMRKLIDQALSDSAFVRFAMDVVRSVPAHDEAGEVAAIFAWVQANIRYTKDPVTKEKLYPPQELLKTRAGDCDDMAMLIAAIAIADGYPARLVTVSSSPDSPDEFSHVYVEVEVPPGSGNWIALDAARPGAAFGRSPEYFFRKRAWSLTDDTYADLNGASQMRGLNGYARLGAVGDFDWSSLLQQTVQETPQIIAAAQGTPTRSVLPSGATVSTGSPYASFVTPYTPGYGAPAAGYPLSTLNAASSSIFTSALPWLAIGAVLILAFRK